MKRLTKEQVLMLHSALLCETGGTDGLRDEGLLEAALNAPFQSFDGVEMFPSLQQKAARLGYGLISNHAFVDGNKALVCTPCWYFLLSMISNWNTRSRNCPTWSCALLLARMVWRIWCAGS